MSSVVEYLQFLIIQGTGLNALRNFSSKSLCEIGMLFGENIFYVFLSPPTLEVSEFTF